MTSKPDLSFALTLPPEEAITYFRQKGYAFSWAWHDIWQEAHAKAFTVAKAMQLDILQDIRGEVDRAVATGSTMASFIDNLTPRLQAKGWWGKHDLTGEQLGSPHRLETIFRTNVQNAYAAGRWKEMKDNADDRPWWQYMAIMDSRTRPGHSALNGKVFRHDDVFWRTHYPPNGFNCRCGVRALTDNNIVQRGLTIEKGEDSMVRESVRIAPEVDVTVAGYRDPKTGKTIFVDPGWSSNVGEAWSPELRKYDDDLVKAYRKATKTPDKERKPRRTPTEKDAAQLFDYIQDEDLRKMTVAAFSKVTKSAMAVVKKVANSVTIEAKGDEKGGSYYMPGKISMGTDARYNRPPEGFNAGGTVVRHEFGHHVDCRAGMYYRHPNDPPWAIRYRSEHIDFLTALTFDKNELMREKRKDDGAGRLHDFFKVGGKYYNVSAVSDLIGAITRHGVVGRWGHFGSYYDDRGLSGQSRQAFANLFDIYSRPDIYGKEVVRDVERLAPKTTKIFKKIMAELEKNVALI